VVQQDPLDGVPADLVTDMPKGVPESRVAPRRVVVGHADDQLGDRLLGPRSTGASLLRAVVLFRDEPSIPAEDRVGRDNAGYPPKRLSSENLALHGETATLIVVQPKPSSTKPFTKDAILLHQILDDLLLVAVHSAGEQEQEEAQGMRW
jgi:hypothetical protein